MATLPDTKAAELIQDKIKEVPTQPGCYLFMDKLGYIIYVGKAKNLRNRVKSYFSPAAATNWRTAGLIPMIADIDYFVTESELDALLLEFKLIKKYKPRFNSQMKSEKQRPYLRVSSDEPYATFSYCLQVFDDGGDYYDFFLDEDDVKQTLALLGKAWGIPQCGQRTFEQSQSPCLYHTIDNCMAPCSREPDKDRYAAAVKEIKKLFNGKKVKLTDELKRKMWQAAENLAFEKAAKYKEVLDSLQRIQNRSRLRFHLPEKGAVLLLISPYREKAFTAFYIVDKQILHRVDFSTVPDDTKITKFIASLDEVNVSKEDSEWLGNCLVEVAADKKFILLPKGKRAKYVIEKAIKQYAKC